MDTYCFVYEGVSELKDHTELLVRPSPEDYTAGRKRPLYPDSQEWGTREKTLEDRIQELENNGVREVAGIKFPKGSPVKFKADRKGAALAKKLIYLDGFKKLAEPEKDPKKAKPAPVVVTKEQIDAAPVERVVSKKKTRRKTKKKVLS